LSWDVRREGCGSGLEAVDMKRSGGEGGCNSSVLITAVIEVKYGKEREKE
jgi:hypothetical protein